MKNKILLKITAVMLIGSVTLSYSTIANAKTASTTFGTMTYSLTKITTDSPPYKVIKASTSMPSKSKVFSYVKTTLEIQKNSTGCRINKGDVKTPYTANKKVSNAIEYHGYDGIKYAAFSCHEVVGKGSHEEYLSKAY